MSDAQISQKEITRLQKLLAMARDKSATEAEAEAFLQKAQELMAVHNLTMAQVESQGQSAGEDGKREKTREVGRALYQYQRRLMDVIARSNFCLCWLVDIPLETYQEAWAAGRRKPRKRQGYTLIGRQSNVIATKTMFDYLNETMERLVPITNNAERLSRWAISWKEGCADRLGERIRDRAETLRKESERRADEERARQRHPSAAPGTALVISLADVALDEADLNNDFNYGLEPGTTKARRLAALARWKDPAEVEKRRIAAEQRAAEEADQAARETPAQKRAREERERIANERWWASYERRQQRARERLDQGAYRQGAEAGSKISLDQQLEEGSRAAALPSA